MLSTHDEYEPWNNEAKAERCDSSGQLNVEDVQEHSHDQNDEAVAYLYDHLWEYLVYEDVAYHQVEPQHYPNVENARKVLFRQHSEYTVELVEW